jgi:Bacterial RNA polymerase, alpha chain C terminal domain
MVNTIYENTSLILAAEDCSPEEFEKLHYFSKQEQRFISNLIAHGPVLLKGARGSGKSALMIEASRRMYPENNLSSTFGIYISLRHLELLRSEGEKYERMLSQLIIDAVNKTIIKAGHLSEFEALPNITSLQRELSSLSSASGKRIVILFDDAAHIGREAPLHEFFDIFRTLSSSIISCKAAIYPGVTNFGTRFDVYNDATVIDISRNDELEDYNTNFAEIIRKRFSQRLPEESFSGQLALENVAGFMGRAVLGNMRGFIFAWNNLSDNCKTRKINYANITKTLIYLARNYYWPLIEELKPKLGMYALMIDPATEIAESIFQDAGKQNKQNVLILREIAQRLSKPLELLEYTGFISIRDVSRAMKSRGRGTRYSLNLCTLLEKTRGARVTNEIYTRWLNEKNERNEPLELHKTSELFKIQLPELPEHGEMLILKEDISKLKKSHVYPYGLTERKIDILKAAGYLTVSELVEASDESLLKLKEIGMENLKRIRSTVAQAIWM